MPGDITSNNILAVNNSDKRRYMKSFLLKLSQDWELSEAEVCAILGKEGEFLAHLIEGNTLLGGRDAVERFMGLLEIKETLERRLNDKKKEYAWLREFNPDLSDAPISLLLHGTMNELMNVIYFATHGRLQ